MTLNEPGKQKLKKSVTTVMKTYSTPHLTYKALGAYETGYTIIRNAHYRDQPLSSTLAMSIS